MKKIYLQPEIESLPMNMAWALCDGTPTNNSAPQNPGDILPPAPVRKVF